MGKLAELLGPRVYLDTNIIIYIVEGFELHAAAYSRGRYTPGQLRESGLRLVSH